MSSIVVTGHRTISHAGVSIVRDHIERIVCEHDHSAAVLGDAASKHTWILGGALGVDTVALTTLCELGKRDSILVILPGRINQAPSDAKSSRGGSLRLLN
jgi:hypothetical protein